MRPTKGEISVTFASAQAIACAMLKSNVRLHEIPSFSSCSAALIPSQVEASFIRMRSLLIPASLYILINLVKNAQESGSAFEDVVMQVSLMPDTLNIAIKDRGAGMSEQVLKNALIPFYSTKQSGTGLGLALCREIIEAHEGKLSIHNRQGGGLEVVVSLPQVPVNPN